MRDKAHLLYVLFELSAQEMGRPPAAAYASMIP
jgi:hypothetical protein